MQLRLVAGPLNDAGAAAKICAVLTENKRPCETAIFDGQRLSLEPDDRRRPRPSAAAPARHRQAGSGSSSIEESKKPESTAERDDAVVLLRPEKLAIDLLIATALRELLTRLSSHCPHALVPAAIPDHIARDEKNPVPADALSGAIPAGGRFLTVGYALYLRYLAVEFSTVALACDAGLQTMLCKSRALATYLFKNSVFGIVALIVATLHVMRPSIVLLTGGLVAAGLGIVLYNIVLSGIAIGLLILGFARPAPATA